MTTNKAILAVAGLLAAMVMHVGPISGADKEAEGLKTEAVSQGVAGTGGNAPVRCEWFKDQALGMFIHWSVDCPLGSVISHHLVGSTKDYQDRFFTQMPGMFCPKDFHPRDWARLAKLAGMKYVVFTTKHHAGFCMWDTKTTDFNIMKTPYAKDITRELFGAFAPRALPSASISHRTIFGCSTNKATRSRRTRPEANPKNNPELMRHNLAQVRELLTGYGKIDFIFFDGEPEQLKQLSWKLDPQILVTRGEMKTPSRICRANRCRAHGRRTSRWARSGRSSRRTRSTSPARN